MTAPSRVLTVLVSSACAVAAGSLVAPAADAAPAAAPAAVTTPAAASADFYTPPSTLPAKDGTIIKQEPMRLGISLWLPGMFGQLPGKASRIMYKSTDSNGKPVAVTGVYIEPNKAWTGAGERPLASMASGTIGQGDQCAPSKGFEKPIAITGQGSVAINYEIPTAYRFLDQGVAVVFTDYVGLGTPDRLHTYVNRADQGHAVIDAARAARSVKDASVTPTSKVVTYGYSQGGGASASAAELQPTYGKDVNLVGAYAGGPPANLFETLKTIDGSALSGALGWSLNGFMQAYPQLKPIVDAQINDKGRNALSRLSTMCTVDAVLNFAFQKSSSWTKNGQSLSAMIAASPESTRVLEEQRLGRRTPSVPVRITTGTKDDAVPHPQAKQLARDYCSRGVPVSYRQVDQLVPSLGLLVNHLAPALIDQQGAQQWAMDRIAGKPANNMCSQIPAS